MASTTEFTFTRPKEALTFHPSEEEFADPLAYIRKIRPVAENYGICKIKPPQHWTPPFAADPAKFRFVPRVQKLHELDAITRIKLNFLEKIKRFWELQGTTFKVPVVGQKPLDLYRLHQLVNSNEFKNPDLCDDKKWKKVAKRMGTSSSFGSQLQTFYYNILRPYDLWKDDHEEKEKTTTNLPDKMSKKAAKKRPPRRRTGQLQNKNVGVLFGQAKVKDKDCGSCKVTKDEDKMVTCEGCNKRYHVFCLKPVLEAVPKGIWHCPDCIEERLCRTSPCSYGFEQAQKEYTLQEFGDMADKFKSNYFNMPACRVPLEVVEKEFWRIVSAIDEQVTVEYGADLDPQDHISGLVNTSSLNSQKISNEKGSGWNFNKLPTLEGSVFSHFTSNISGMTSPWIYVGMCFSTFCWHNEDHWSYSISYLHRGEPKTWYGVPGSRAQEFENAMKSAAPELFDSSPDLLHQLITIVNPGVLMKAKVPVYRIDQKPGEFIITFPRAYHAGFNQGYNYAEAVNFAPADWISMGRECMEHYSKLKRPCVFSHDELIISMAKEPKKLDWLIASAARKDLEKIIAAEKEIRYLVYNRGVKRCEKVMFETFPDDERQCDICKTTLFLSAISCKHFDSPSVKKLVCMKHYEQFGCGECAENPSGFVMKYRYSMDDLPVMMKALKLRTDKFDQWTDTVSTGLSGSTPNKLSLAKLRLLVKEAHEKGYPRTTLLEEAEVTLAEAERAGKRARKEVTSSGTAVFQSRFLHLGTAN